MAFAWVGVSIKLFYITVKIGIIDTGTFKDNKIPFGFVDFTTNTPLSRQQGKSDKCDVRTVMLSEIIDIRFVPEYDILSIPDAQIWFMSFSPIFIATQGQGSTLLQSWGGGSDSYFEYLIKYARLSNTDDPLFADTWAAAIDSSINNLLRSVSHPYCPQNFVLITPNLRRHLPLGTSRIWLTSMNKRIRHVGSHLACFNGVRALALRLLHTYLTTGASPEFQRSFGSQLAFNAQHGFYITGADYILRPEVLESNFYAWRATGDIKYLDNAVAAINSFNRFLRATVGFAGINDVNNPNSTKIDDTQSFWFAEVLKYL
ncbi:glycoside hydrolase family protein [Salix suchowensis]|nr:glycoside hydrolase family protein [Salix suchowensis]